MRSAALAAVALCAAAPVSAATYVAPPAGSDGANGVSTPFRTLARAFNSARSGDSIVLRAGSYSGGLTLSQPGVSIASYPGEVAVISTPVSGSADNTLVLSPGAI